MTVWAQCSQRPTWPPSATVRQRSIALITFSWSPTTWALQQVGSYPGYTGRDADIVAAAALDPERPFLKALTCKHHTNTSFASPAHSHRQSPPPPLHPP